MDRRHGDPGRQAAARLSASAEIWSDTCQDKPIPVCASFVICLFPLLSYPTMATALLFFFWAAVQAASLFKLQ